MSKNVDYELADASAVIDRVKENSETLTQKGFTKAKEDALVNAYNEVKLKNGVQLKAVKLAIERTAAQNAAFNNLLGLITRIQNAAKSAYGRNDAVLKKFRVGDKQPNTVGRLTSWGEYFTGIILEHDEDLLANGLLQEDLTNLSLYYANLIAADTSQESAKKLQASATIERDKAMHNLRDHLMRTRNFVKAAFAKNPEILVQFKPLPKGRSSAQPGTAEASGTTETVKTEVTIPA
ncbi:MAG: hypothetical protein C4539_05795 [Ignavibacteriales bacterium]|nr:MAG: hypothetical protein C4539_05795 [Ignavibacteriales bacterium]